MAALRIAGDEQLAVVLHRLQQAGQGLAGSAQRVHHVLGRLVGIQVRVVGQFRRVVTRVIGRHHDEALRRIGRGNQRGFGIRRAGFVQQVRQVVAFHGRRAMGIQHDRAAAGAVRAARGRHQCAGSVGAFAGAAHGAVADVLHIDAALGRAGNGQEVAAARACVELGGKVAGGKKGGSQWRVLDQRAARRRVVNDAQVVGGVAPAGGQQGCCRDDAQ